MANLLKGDEENFSIVMRAYTPSSSKCSEVAQRVARPKSEACKTILNDLSMKASSETVTFGAKGVWGVQEQTPITLTERKEKLQLSLEYTLIGDSDGSM